MPHHCVRCASELPEPFPEHCPRCGLLVSRSLPPVEAQQAPIRTTDRQALASRDDQVVGQSDLSIAEQDSAFTFGELTTSPALPQANVWKPLWLPIGITALLSSLLLCGLALIPLGPAFAQWRSGAASQIAQLTTGTPTHSATPITSKPYEFHDTLLRGNLWGWPEYAGHCFFADDGFHVKDGVICQAPIRALANGEFVVTMRIVAARPEQSMGVFFRMTDQDNSYVVALAHIGAWSIGKKVDGAPEILKQVEHEEAIHAGLNAPNTVEIVMRGDDLTIYLNTIQVGSVADTSFSGGLIGLIATPGTEAVFTDVSVIADP